MSSQPFFVPAVACVLVSIPLVLRRVPPNRYYGVRIKRAFEDERIWYSLNRVGGIALSAAGAFYLVFARVIPYEKGSPNDLVVWAEHLAAFVGPVAAALFVVGRAARRVT